MSRYPFRRNRDGAAEPLGLRDSRMPSHRASGRERRKAVVSLPARAEPPSRPRPRRRERLWEPEPGRVERAGHGMARWGRFQLPADSVEALRAAGSFGTVALDDLHSLFQTTRRARNQLRKLQREGLIRAERFRRGDRSIKVASLTATGKRLMERHVDPRDPGDENAQRYRAGAPRTTQVLHDVAVYRAARREMQAIQERGGRVVLVRTDDDLRQLVAWRAGRARRAGASQRRAKANAAASLGLTMRGSNVTYPDIRVEFEHPEASDGPARSGYIDVEVATLDYREPALRAKGAAGFRIYRIDASGNLCTGVPALGSELNR